MTRWTCVAAALLALAGCATGDAPGAPAAPLEGRIWDVAGGRFVDEPTLVDALALRRYVLLGEVHDNPAQHRLQARLLRALVHRGRRPAVVFEMIRRDQAPALAAALAASAPRADEVRRAVDWDASGWPAFPLYAPVFEAALEAQLPIVAGDLSRADREALRGGGIAALGPARVAALGLDVPLDSASESTLAASIREGHCDLLPEAAVPGMVAFQRARDAQLARASVDAGAGDGVVLITGTGHARRDVAVPVALARLDPDATIASLGLVEADDVSSDPRAFLSERFDGEAPFDFVWFTPAAPREDPCEGLRRHLVR